MTTRSAICVLNYYRPPHTTHKLRSWFLTKTGLIALDLKHKEPFYGKKNGYH